MVRTAMTLLSSWNEVTCVIRVHKVCHSLASLVIQSSCQRHNVLLDDVFRSLSTPTPDSLEGKQA